MKTSIKTHTPFFLFFIILFEFSVYIANDMLLPALATIFNELKADSKLIPLSVGLFLGGAASIQLFCGPLSDHLGRRKAIMLGGTIILIGNAIGIASFDIVSFFIARVFQGMGLCFITVAGYACLHELFSQKEAIKNIAWISSTAAISPLIGPTLGSLVLIFAGWRYIFVATFLFVLVAVVGLYFTMPETLPQEKRTRFRFSALIPSYRELASNRAFSSLCFLSASAQLTMITWVACSPILLIKYLNFSTTSFGLIQIPVFLSIISGKLVLRKLANTIELGKLFVLGFIIVIIGGTLLFLSGILASKETLIYFIMSGMMVYCFGFGIFNVTITRLILESTEKPKGISNGFNAFIMLLLATIELLLISMLPLSNPVVFSTCLSFPILIAFLLFRLIKRRSLVSFH